VKVFLNSDDQIDSQTTKVKLYK